jgi:predicted ArsR family transcriptional regulator
MLSETQTKLMNVLLKSTEGKTADELVTRVGITKTAVREHLERLSALGYVRFEDDRGGVGRPRRRYLVSPEGAHAFPKQYSWLSNQVLAELSRSLSPADVGDFMKRLADRVYEENSASLHSSDPEIRLRLLAKLMNNLGYRAKLTKPGEPTATIEAFNCVYHDVAKTNPRLCEFDLQLIRRSTGGDVTLDSCIARGGGSCRFTCRRKA